MSDEPVTQSKRRGRRRRDGGDHAAALPPQAPWGQPIRRFDPVDLVGEEEIEIIHQTSLQILDEIGMDFLNPQARSMLHEAGARVDPDSARVRFDPEFIEATIATAPSEFTIHARNPDRNVHMGGSSVAFTAVSSPPNTSDEAGGRRVGNRKDFQNLLRLGQTINTVHMWGGYPVEPVDIHPSIRHLDALYDMLTLSDRVIHGYSLGHSAIGTLSRWSGSLAVDDATLDEEPSIHSVINASSPLRYDTRCSRGSSSSAPAIRSSSSPVHPRRGNGSGDCGRGGGPAQRRGPRRDRFTQVVRPRAPVMYGGFTQRRHAGGHPPSARRSSCRRP
jgi:trimethylamine--corrinoid protein Co-methyltransferase